MVSSNWKFWQQHKELCHCSVLEINDSVSLNLFFIQAISLSASRVQMASGVTLRGKCRRWDHHDCVVVSSVRYDQPLCWGSTCGKDTSVWKISTCSFFLQEIRKIYEQFEEMKEISSCSSLLPFGTRCFVLWGLLT